MGVKIFSVFIVLLLATTPAEKQLSFANHLFEEGDYFRAITEYKRLIFISSNPDNRRFAQQRIFQSYKRAGRLEDAALFLRAFEDEHYRNTETGKLYLLMDDTQQARQFFKLVNSDTVRLLIGWSYLREGAWKNSEETLLSIPHNSDLSGTATRLATYARDAEGSVRTKSPYVSGLLSALIPGAGRFYAERPGDGLFSFLTVAIPAVISYLYWQDERKRASAIAAGFAGAFYLGDIYGSVVATGQYNRYSRTKYLETIEDQLHIREYYIE